MKENFGFKQEYENSGTKNLYGYEGWLEHRLFIALHEHDSRFDLFRVVVHYDNSYECGKTIALNSTREYCILAADDLSARGLAIQKLKKEWEDCDITRIIKILYCEVELKNYLD